jgi:hypothetical protein
MRLNNAWLLSLLLSGLLPGSVRAQVDREDPDFVKQSPAIGESFPDLTVFTLDGKEFRTSSLSGNYTVVSFGCLTCPPFMRKITGLEAVYRDYGPKNVRFCFIYKALAHPERNGIVQPLTQEERLHQAREATKRLGNTIPFLVDTIDNRLKHALIDRNNVPLGEPATYDNAEFIIDPKGTIVRKRTWSNPEQVRKDLEELVGKAERITRPEDVILNVEKPPPDPAVKGTIEKLPRSGMLALVSVPHIDSGGPPFFAKLRVEADRTVIEKGEGKLYLGFHLDPFLGAHWNNLKKPLRFDFELPEGVKFSAESGESPQPNAASDIDPREFLLDVLAWPEKKTVRMTVTYTACTDTVCHDLYQTYELHRDYDRDGGRAVGSLGRYTPETPLRKEELPSPTKIASLFFAMVFWPCWIPFAAAKMEHKPSRRRGFHALGAVGLILGCACYIPAVLHPDELLVVGMDGHYGLSPGSVLKLYACMIWQGLYLAFSSMLMLTSQQRRLRVFGLSVAATAVIAHVAFRACECVN